MIYFCMSEGVRGSKVAGEGEEELGNESDREEDWRGRNEVSLRSNPVVCYKFDTSPLVYWYLSR